MRFVDRDSIPVPEAFSHPSAHEGRRALLRIFEQDDRKLHQTRLETVLDSKGPSGSKDVRGALLRLFRGRCAFCEAPLSEPNIYRFRPTSNAEPVEDASVSHLYYAWLAEAWQNLYPICSHCLPEYPNYFPVKGRRAGLPKRQVLESFAERSDGRWPDYPLEERSELLDPCRDRQLWRSLLFRSTGEIIGISRRGHETIRHFQLDRFELRESRRRAIVDAINQTERAIRRESVVSFREDLGHQGASELYLREVLFEALRRSGSRDLSRQITTLARLADGIDRFHAAIAEIDARSFVVEPSSATLGPSGRPDSLESVSIRNFKSLEEIHIDLPLPLRDTDQAIPALLILGENATGKSTILEAIALAVMPEPARSKLGFQASNAVLDPRFLGAPDQVAPPEAAISTKFAGQKRTKLTLSGRHGGQVIHRGDAVHLPVFAYGAYRQYLKGERNFAAHKHVRSLFHPDELLSNPERWLLKLGDAEFDMVVRALREVFNLEGSFEVLERNEGKIFVIVAPDDKKHGSPLSTPIELVSSGFRAVLAMLCDIMQGLMDDRVNPGFESLDSAGALVLIDEVEAHLHPRWKMSIMTGLRRALPGVTFIATSHDPLCLRGMKKGEVIVLERISGDQTQSELPVFTHSIVDLPDNENWTVEQLLTADFFQMRTTESLAAERRAAKMEDRLARGTKPLDDPELAAYLAELSAELPIGHTEVHRLVQEAIATFLRERRKVSDEKLRALRENTRQSILEALRSVG
jgi:hypothetical protein